MQQKVKEFNDMKKSDENLMSLTARLLDIQSELGELAKEYLKSSEYGLNEFELKEDFELELGDVLYSLLSLANELKIDANLAIDKVLEKYKNRLKEKDNIGSGN